MRGVDLDDEGELRAWLRAEEERPFTGWDFSYLTGRVVEELLPWDYRRLVLDALPGRRALLDMGTGGGEFLAALIGELAERPATVCATEGYPPNVPVARARLEPLGVRVVQIGDDGQLPFEDGAFDLVINRHESYAPREVRRVLRPGGRFITQQVGGSNDLDLNRLLGAPDPDLGLAHWTLAHARAELEEAGIRVAAALEAYPVTRFLDVGAIVYYLKVISWQIPDFGVERYFDRLRTLHERCQAEGGIAVGSHRFLLAAERPA